jgi:hypothetical protein
VEHPPEFQIRDRALDLRHVGFDGGKRGVVALVARQIEQLAAVLDMGGEPGEREHDAVERLFFAAEPLRPLPIAPDLRILDPAADRRKPRPLNIEVKDTSEAARCGFSIPRSRCRWR